MINRLPSSVVLLYTSLSSGRLSILVMVSGWHLYFLPSSALVKSPLLKSSRTLVQYLYTSGILLNVDSYAVLICSRFIFLEKKNLFYILNRCCCLFSCLWKITLSLSWHVVCLNSTRKCALCDGNDYYQPILFS